MRSRLAQPGPFLVVRIVTTFSWSGGAGTRVYPNDRRPVAPRQQVRGGRERPTLAERAGGHIRIPAHWPRFAARPSVGACAPVAAASAPSPDPRRGPRSAARSLRRDAPSRHWRGAAAATSGFFADLPRRLRREPAGFRSAQALAGPRISASLPPQAGRRRRLAE